jgi:hypothetical protein
MRSRVVLLTVLVAAGLIACASPEATRMRGGGPGADVGNRPQVVRMHEGSRPFYHTPQLIARATAPEMEPGQQADRLSRK